MQSDDRAPSKADAPPKLTIARKRRSIPSWVIWLLALAAIAVGVTTWFRFQAAQPALVQVGTAEIRPLEASFTAEAYVRGRDYELSSQASGRVVECPYREGDAVARGAVILTVESSEAQAQIRRAVAALATARAEASRARAAYASTKRLAESRISAAQTRVSEAEAALRRAKVGARKQEVIEAEQRLAKANAALNEAEKAYRRAQALFAEGAISRSSLDAAEGRYLTAQADVGAAKASLSLVEEGPRREDVAIAEASVRSARAELAVAIAGRGELQPLWEAVRAADSNKVQAQAEVDTAKAIHSKSTLRAPADGVITRLKVDRGGFAAAGSPVITLSTREDMRIEAEISSEDAAKLRVGMPLKVTSPTYPGQKFDAVLQSTMPVGELKPDAAIRTRIIRARVRLTGGWAQFRPGMEVDVEGTTVLRKALTVPSDAIVIAADKTEVFIVSDGLVEERPVTVGMANAEVTEILSGLREGEQVVTVGKEGVKSGSRVEVRR